MLGMTQEQVCAELQRWGWQSYIPRERDYM